jgi:putative toxin-antitoxin system antitoxin component (TIGR02293 family)
LSAIQDTPSSPNAEARVKAEATRVFGDADRAERWLRKPIADFGGAAPLSLLSAENGLEVVEEALAQIDHGIFA